MSEEIRYCKDCPWFDDIHNGCAYFVCHAEPQDDVCDELDEALNEYNLQVSEEDLHLENLKLLIRNDEGLKEIYNGLQKEMVKLDKNYWDFYKIFEGFFHDLDKNAVIVYFGRYCGNKISYDSYALSQLEMLYIRCISDKLEFIRRE